MTGEDLLAKLCEDTKALLELHLKKQPGAIVASVDWMNHWRASGWRPWDA